MENTDIKALVHRVKELENTVQAHQISLTTKEAIIENKNLIIEQLQEALKIALARKYGRSAESYVDPNQMDLFDEAETGVIIDNDSGEVINVPGIGSVGRLAPTAHRTVRTDPYTAPHVKHTSMLR